MCIYQSRSLTLKTSVLFFLLIASNRAVRNARSSLMKFNLQKKGSKPYFTHSVGCTYSCQGGMLQCFVEKIFLINLTQFIRTCVWCWRYHNRCFIFEFSFQTNGVNHWFKYTIWQQEKGIASLSTLLSNTFDNGFHKLKYSQTERKISKSKC